MAINLSSLFNIAWRRARVWARRDGTKVRNEFRRALRLGWSEIRPGTPGGNLMTEFDNIRAQIRADKAAGKFGRWQSRRPWRFANARF